MENSVCKMAARLRHITDTPVEVCCLPGHVYRIGVSCIDLEILIYPDEAEERIRDSRTAKTIHIDRDTLVNNEDKIFARMQAILGHARKIPARATIATRIDKKVALDFQNEHHLQAALPGKYRYGLYENCELVTVAVFSGGRRMRDKPDDYRSFELLRFCHKTNNITVGGLSKLIHAFRKEFRPGDIMTYVDRDWTQDSSLRQVGFQEEKITEPHCFIVQGNIREHVKMPVDKNAIPAGYYLKKNNGSIKLVLNCTEY